MTLQAINRSSTARRGFGALVLLAFVLKALLPPGVMLARFDERAQLVICGEGIGPAAASTPPMAGMDHSAHAAHATHTSQGCPYAQANAVGAAAHYATHSVPWFSALQLAVVSGGTPVSPDPPLRYRAPRGPPSPTEA
jgi:hypothetical protein